MNLVGYLITLANLQGFNRSGGPIQDLSIKVGEIQTLLYDLKKYPQFQIQNFRETGYRREGNIGIYLSKNLRDYVYNGIGRPTDEAILLALIFNDAMGGDAQTNISDPDKTLSYFLTKGEPENDVRQGINQYLNTLSNRRQERTVSNTMQ